MKLDHVAITVENLERAVEWYIEHLGASIEYKDSTWAMLKIADVNLALTLPDQHPRHIAFVVNSLDCFPEGKIKEHRDGSLYLYQPDSEGNIIEWIYWPARGNTDEQTSLRF